MDPGYSTAVTSGSQFKASVSRALPGRSDAEFRAQRDGSFAALDLPAVLLTVLELVLKATKAGHVDCTQQAREEHLETGFRGDREGWTLLGGHRGAFPLVSTTGLPDSREPDGGVSNSKLFSLAEATN